MRKTQYIMRPTALERLHGRFLRSPDGHGDSAGGSDNQPGNVTDSQSAGESNQNNAGQTDVPEQFWTEPEAKPDLKIESQVQDNKQFGQQLGQRIASLPFAPVFNDDIAEQISKGDLAGANAAMEAHGRAAVQKALEFSAEVMQRFGASLMDQVQQRIETALGGRDNNASLEAAFPSIRDDAKARGLVTRVFDQAMKLTGNDRTKAIAHTKEMLRLTSGTLANDIGLDIPPVDRGGDIGDGPAALVAELLGRQ